MLLAYIHTYTHIYSIHTWKQPAKMKAVPALMQYLVAEANPGQKLPK